MHSNERNHVCTFCEKAFPSKSALKIHENVAHLKEKNFKYVDCGLAFLWKISLTKHLKSIHITETKKKELLNCSFCDKTFFNTVNLKRHVVDTHEQLGNLNFKCETCSKGFKSKGEFRAHVKIHLTDSYSCQMCDKKLTSLFVLKSHEASFIMFFQNSSLFQCSVCHKELKTIYTLKTHIRSHTAEKQKCNLCESELKGDAGLQEHLKRFHSKNPKKYQCEKCFKFFSQTKLLKAHVENVHAEYNNIECTVCHKMYKTEQALKFHKRIHESRIDFHCGLCPKQYGAKSDLRRHERTVHANDKIEEKFKPFK